MPPVSVLQIQALLWVAHIRAIQSRSSTLSPADAAASLTVRTCRLGTSRLGLGAYRLRTHRLPGKVPGIDGNCPRLARLAHPCEGTPAAIPGSPLVEPASVDLAPGKRRDIWRNRLRPAHRRAEIRGNARIPSVDQSLSVRSQTGDLARRPEQDQPRELPRRRQRAWMRASTPP